MTRQPKDTTHTKGVSHLVAYFLIFLFLYVLSIGPAVKMERSSILNGQIITAVYAPLGFLAEHCPPLQRFIDWYVYDVWRCPRMF
jgi:hypothetical protein